MIEKVAIAVVAAALAGAGVTAWTLLSDDPDTAASPSRTFVTHGPEPTTTVTPANERPKRPQTRGYRLAGVRRGGKVAVRDAPGGRVKRRLGAFSEFGSPRVFWIAEARGNWLGVVAPEIGNNRLGWVRRDASALRFGRSPYSIQVDLSDRLVQLRRGDHVIRNVVVSVGRFGSDTPPGRFAVTDRIADPQLPDVYGCCAIALSAHQPNPPAGWIGGNRIAIHGWNGPVGEAASGGCLRASNADMTALMRRVPLGTPVMIRS
jgi:hypothetical protein